MPRFHIQNFGPKDDSHEGPLEGMTVAATTMKQGDGGIAPTFTVSYYPVPIPGQETTPYSMTVMQCRRRECKCLTAVDSDDWRRVIVAAIHAGLDAIPVAAIDDVRDQGTSRADWIKRTRATWRREEHRLFSEVA